MEIDKVGRLQKVLENSLLNYSSELFKDRNVVNQIFDAVVKYTVDCLESTQGQTEKNALLDLGANVIARNEGISLNWGESINKVCGIAIRKIDELPYEAKRAMIENLLEHSVEDKEIDIDVISNEVFQTVLKIAKGKFREESNTEDIEVIDGVLDLFD